MLPLVMFGSDCRNNCGDCTPKEAFKLLYMWKSLYRTLPYNRQLQALFFSGLNEKRYWMQWLVLEEIVPLPSLLLPGRKIADIWGMPQDLLHEKYKDETSEDAAVSIYKYTWKGLHSLALLHHGDYMKLQAHVIAKQSSEWNDDLVRLYREYRKYRFEWIFSYWIFGLSKCCARQLQKIYLWWQRYDAKKTCRWGSSDCDVRYLATLHNITEDFWNGKLVPYDESIGIQTLENYFSMCRSLLAWISGRKWGSYKQKKVYKETLEGVYHVLKSEMQESLINHSQFWLTAKLQMFRICKLEETAGNYVNWNIIDSLPHYKLFMNSGNPLYLAHIRGFLVRKWMINNWIIQEENHWVSNILPDSLFRLLEYDTKILADTLHGDSSEAYLSRLIWLYLHSGEQIYMEALKGFVYDCAYASYSVQLHESASLACIGF
ncbi:uncharacterized protein [Hyperolius riggenbachi]|uniref:uncharacterized protein isoform X2 n=1 Tax=Hyperolius riggenbachi TaxID=752182 RepID=UPI0035A333D2